jgi:rubredoxin
MSFTHHRELRCCRVCQHGWYAESGYPASRPNQFLHGKNANIALSHTRTKYEQYMYCPSCGGAAYKPHPRKTYLDPVTQKVRNR